MLKRGRTPHLLVRLSKGLRRLDLVRREDRQAIPVDKAWHEMLARLDAEEAERRLDAMARRLNGGSQR